MTHPLARLHTLGIRHPVMQAGMPEVANVRLAAAVARAGGIGTLGLQDVSTWEQSLRLLRTQACGHPVNANLLLPYTRRRHIEGVIRQGIPLVTFFWGRPGRLVRRLQGHGIYVFQQVGSQREAKQALDAGVDALIVQGSEAGGHVRGWQKLDEVLPEVVASAAGVPVFAAGGMYTAADAQRAQALGAHGVSSGTRFLLTHESGAHPDYKQRLLEADTTLVTTLFGAGWPAPHRVVSNAATARWCAADGSIAPRLQRTYTALGLTRKLLPLKAEAAALQHPRIPFFSAAALTESMPASGLEATALYAGEHVGRITSLLPADTVVQELAQAFAART